MHAILTVCLFVCRFFFARIHKIPAHPPVLSWLKKASDKALWVFIWSLQEIYFFHMDLREIWFFAILFANSTKQFPHYF